MEIGQNGARSAKQPWLWAVDYGQAVLISWERTENVLFLTCTSSTLLRQAGHAQKGEQETGHVGALLKQ